MSDFEMLLGGRGLPGKQRRRLVSSLLQQPLSLVVSGLGAMLAAAVCWLHSGNTWFIAWGATGSVVLSLRLGLAMMFHRRSESLSAETWAWAFFVGGAIAAAIAGVGAACTTFWCSDMVAMTFMATNVISFAGGAAVRNNASPLAAKCQTAIALGLPGVACIATGVPFLEAFAVLIAFHLAAQFEIIRCLGEHTLWLISAEEEQKLSKIELSITCQRLEEANTRLTRLSATDGLTGLSNRRTFDEVLKAEWARAFRSQSCLALLMIDVDHFKQFNDRYGHLAGDDALRGIAEQLRSALHRSSDLAARYGGEEFAVLLPETDCPLALFTAEQIREAVAAMVISVDGQSPVRVSVSIGVAAMTPNGEDSRLFLVKEADQALYAAKGLGRDRIRRAGRSSS